MSIPANCGLAVTLKHDGTEYGKSAKARFGKYAEVCGSQPMGKNPTHRIRVDVLRKLIDERNISVGNLAKATKLSRKGLTNILEGRSHPREDNLVKIAAALGVKWRTLVEGYEAETEEMKEGGVVFKTTVDATLDIRSGKMTEDEAIEVLKKKLKGRLKNIDEVRIVILRDEDNED